MRDLLLVGRDLRALLPHSFELGNHFSTTTLAVADDVLARAAVGVREGYEAIVVFLSSREDAPGLHELVETCPRLLFLTPDRDLPTCAQIEAAGGLVLSVGEPSIIVLATLLAFSNRGQVATGD